MSHCTTSLLCGAVALLAVGTTHAQDTRSRKVRDDRPRVHQMELFNGPSRTVRSYGVNLSPGEASTLGDLDRLENEAAYVRDLNALKRQYVLDERVLEPYRTTVQLDLYGRTITSNNYNAASAVANYGGYGYGYGYGYPYYRAAGYGLVNAGGYATALAGSNQTETRSLANGVGDEGVLKNTLSGVIAQQATPAYAASVDRDYQRVAYRASGSRTLQVALGLPTTDAARKDRDRYVQLDAETSSSAGVTLTLKNGDRVYGSKIRESKDWITVDLLKGGATRIRPSEVVRIDTAKGARVVPADDEE